MGLCYMSLEEFDKAEDSLIKQNPFIKF
ncbi:hypothetical protein [Flavobacterium paronense]